MTQLLAIAVVEDEETQRRKIVSWLADDPGRNVGAGVCEE